MRRWLLKGVLSLVTPVVMLTTGSLEAQQTVRQSPPDGRILQRRIPNTARKGAVAYVRTELFFGTAKSDGTAVTEQEFMGFVDEVIARRFTDGLTVLKGDGEFKGLRAKPSRSNRSSSSCCIRRIRRRRAAAASTSSGSCT